MNTVDITKAAGFKAVDSEGKELGIVSLHDIASEVKKSLVNELGVQPLAEAVAAAATDQYEDQLPQKTDLKYARALDADGNPILIAKEDLASVVGELLPEGDLFTYGKTLRYNYLTTSLADLNTLPWNKNPNSGEMFYGINSTTTNKPAGILQGLCKIIFRLGGTNTCHMFATDEDFRIIKKRIGRWGQQELPSKVIWEEWKDCSYF